MFVITELRGFGSRFELFVDDWLIDNLDNATLKMHQPKPANVAMDFDMPWEGSTPKTRYTTDPCTILNSRTQYPNVGQPERST